MCLKSEHTLTETVNTRKVQGTAVSHMIQVVATHGGVCTVSVITISNSVFATLEPLVMTMLVIVLWEATQLQ